MTGKTLKNTVKLRRVGNSLGTTFRADMIAAAGMHEGQELEVIASPGEIFLRPTTKMVVVSFSVEEAIALARGHISTGFGAEACEKITKAVDPHLACTGGLVSALIQTDT